MKDVKGKYIWIIGASSGIGRALARELAARGAVLALSARSQDKLKALKDEIGGSHKVVPLDVSKPEDCAEATKTIADSFPCIDSVVFLAAVYDPGPLRDMDLDKAHMMIDVNLKGAFNIVHSVLPYLRKQKERGQIVLCASVAGYRGLPAGQPYSATKAGVQNLAESLRAEEPDLDVKVINPGFVKTPMTDKNDFAMPMIISPEEAAKAIAGGLQRKGFEIHFPKVFTVFMKVLQVLPPWLYFMIVRCLVRDGA